MTTLDYTPTVIDDRADVYRVCCPGFRTRFCQNELPAGAAYCADCQVRADDFHARIELVPLVSSYAAHVRAAMADLAIAPVVRRVMEKAA